MITKRKTIANYIEQKQAPIEHKLGFDPNVVYGEQLLDTAIADPTIDKYLDRSPKLNTEKDYEQMVLILQRKRAAFITAEQKRKEPKIEGEDSAEVQAE